MLTESGNRKRCAGLTLIEVLLAATVLAISMTALLAGASRCIAVMRAARYYQEAQWALSLGELEHPIAAFEDVDELEVQGKRYGNLTYSRVVEPRDESEEDGLYILRSRISWQDRGRPKYEEVARFLFVPADLEDAQ